MRGEVAPGEPIEYDADTFNSMVDAALYARSGDTGGAITTFARRPRIRVVNFSTVAVPKYGVLGLSARRNPDATISGFPYTDFQAIQSAPDASRFPARFDIYEAAYDAAAGGFQVLTFSGEEPAESLHFQAQWCVLQEPAEPGGIADAICYGPTIARVSFPGTHATAESTFTPVAGRSHSLLAQPVGNAGLLTMLDAALPAGDLYAGPGTYSGGVTTADMYALVRLGSGLSVSERRIYGTARAGYTVDDLWITVDVVHQMGGDTVSYRVRNAPAYGVTDAGSKGCFSGSADDLIWAEWWSRLLGEGQTRFDLVPTGGYMIYQASCPPA